MKNMEFTEHCILSKRKHISKTKLLVISCFNFIFNNILKDDSEFEDRFPKKQLHNQTNTSNDESNHSDVEPVFTILENKNHIQEPIDELSSR